MADRSTVRGVATIPSTVLRLSGSETIPAAAEASAATATKEALPSAPPSGRYEVLGVLGQGGMGRVDHVRDRDLLRDVAAKHLLPDLRRDRALLEQFLWEARVTAYLDHPNIVPVHELGASPDGEAFFTMKVARGATLEDELEAARVSHASDEDSVSRRVRSFVKVCNAMAFAHARGVLHRDLKPANILVGEYGEVLVSDWGLAVPLEGTAGQDLRRIVPESLSRKSAGTPVYMSPEQARGDALDARSDIYTLGAILYEIVTLKRPVDGDTLAAVLQKVTRGEIVPIETAKPDVSAAMAAVVKKAMAAFPGDRYATATQLADDVETVLDGRTPRAENASVLTRAARYYIARDPVFSKMRVLDIDMWLVSAGLFGAAIAALLATYVASWWGVLLAGAAIAATPPTRVWLRLRAEAARERPAR
jgi:eukaryotic-like serine/threonine-protein kinase